LDEYAKISIKVIQDFIRFSHISGKTYQFRILNGLNYF